MTQGTNILQQQREAAARVRAMEERSRRLVREHPVNVYRGVTTAPAVPCPPPPRETPGRPEPCPQPPCQADRKEGSLSLLPGLDNECMLILLLAVVLAKNGAPMELLLALLYIAL